MAHPQHRSARLQGISFVNPRQSTAAGLLSLFLIGCGGGGDQGVSAPNVVAGTQVERSTSVALAVAVPAAPSAGEILFADAHALRPLADESIWVYRGVRTHNGQASGYSSFRQVTKSLTGYQERVSSPLAGGNRLRELRLQEAQIETTEQMPLASGQSAFSMRAAELRSPVRRGDQITLLPAQSVSLKDDLDGDGKTDFAEVAAWSRVIGIEEVVLPELERTLRALRVDTHVVSSIQFSSKTLPEAATQVLESTWYAPGVGVIRSSRTQASAEGIGPLERDEQLQFWDGKSAGLGLVPSQPVSLTGSTAAIGPWLNPSKAAVRSGNHVVVLSASSSTARSWTVSVLDQRGQLMHSAEHAGLSKSDPSISPDLLVVGDGTALAFREAGVYLHPDQLENLKLVRLDGQARRQGKDVWLVDGAVAGSLRVASDGKTIWVAWLDSGNGDGSRRLLLQAFSETGATQSAVHRLDTAGSDIKLADVTLAAHTGRTLVTWARRSGTETAWMTASINAASVPLVTTLALVPATSAQSGTALTPLLTGNLAAAGWMGSLDRSHALAAPRAVALDNAMQVRRGTSGGLDEELLPLPAGSLQSLERMAMSAQDKAVLWAASGSLRLRGDSDVVDQAMNFAIIDAGDAALSAAVPKLRQLRDSSPAHPAAGAVKTLQHIIPMDDRWMIMGHDGSRATVAVLFKR
jgi:hypothetical protein